MSVRVRYAITLVAIAIALALSACENSGSSQRNAQEVVGVVRQGFVINGTQVWPPPCAPNCR
jgi:hypothetical protein